MTTTIRHKIGSITTNNWGLDTKKPEYELDEDFRAQVLKKADILDMPNITSVCHYGLIETGARHIKAAQLEHVGAAFLASNMFDEILSIDFPRLKEAGDHFCSLSSIQSVNLPSLEHAGRCFLGAIMSMESLDLPMLYEMESGSLEYANKLQNLSAPKLAKIDDDVLSTNTELQELNLPSLVMVGDNFLQKNKKLEVLNAPRLISAGKDCHPLVYKTVRRNQCIMSDFLIKTILSKNFGK